MDLARLVRAFFLRRRHAFHSTIQAFRRIAVAPPGRGTYRATIFKEAEMENTQAIRHRNKGLFFPLMLILAGMVVLLETNGLVDRQTILQLLPLAPIAVGGTLLVARLRRRMG
jgi:hypothetical protein